MARQNLELQRILEPVRLKHAKKVITALGYHIDTETPSEIHFQYRGSVVKFFPYSGWHTGKTIKDGRGLKKLTNQIKQK